MKKWPDHFPEQCPPNTAMPAAGNVYRFINKSNPKERDFKSYYDLKPGHDWGDQACQARGLSVYRTKDACENMVCIIPALAKKKLAVAELNSDDGCIANTPSGNSKQHKTLWSSVNSDKLSEKFKSIELGDCW